MSDAPPPTGPRRTPRARPEPSSPTPAPPRVEPEFDPSIWADDEPVTIAAPRADGPPPAPPAAAAGSTPVDEGPRRSRRLLGIAAGFLVGALLGGGLVALTTKDDEASQVTASGSKASTTVGAEATTTQPLAEEVTTTPQTTAPAVTTTIAPPSPAAQDAMAIAGALGPLPQPSDCGLPLDVAESLPNAARDYRGGVHEGIDFICSEYGRNATTPMDGQVLIADASFVDPDPAERVEILEIAKQLGYTPPWTLAMLFGRFVVIDHGIKPGVGHVVTIYAHLNEIDPAMEPGNHVKAGDRVGEIGNAGTESAGTGEDRPQAIHLHWEIHIDDEFLGAGMSTADTRAVYAELFGQ